MKTVTIYTDGACSGNPGPGGWCAILEYNGHEKLISGGEERTTNNRMELTAVIQALLAPRPREPARDALSLGQGPRGKRKKQPLRRAGGSGEPEIQSMRTRRLLRYSNFVGSCV